MAEIVLGIINFDRVSHSNRSNNYFTTDPGERIDLNVIIATKEFFIPITIAGKYFFDNINYNIIV